MTCGRPSRAAASQARSTAAASSSSTPVTTSTPAARSTSAPPPASADGSRTPTTTRRTPASTRACVHGPVRPVWRQGSRVTTAVSGDAERGVPGGEGVDLGVRGAGAAVPAVRPGHAAGVEQDAADARVRARSDGGVGGQLDRAAHRGQLARPDGGGGATAGRGDGSARGTAGPSSGCWGVPTGPPSARARHRGTSASGRACGRVGAVTCVTGHRTGRRRPSACCLPSGLSPSVLEFHQVNRPLAAVGSRTVTAGSELHRPRSTRRSVSATHGPCGPHPPVCTAARRRPPHDLRHRRAPVVRTRDGSAMLGDPPPLGARGTCASAGRPSGRGRERAAGRAGGGRPARVRRRRAPDPRRPRRPDPAGAPPADRRPAVVPGRGAGGAGALVGRRPRARDLAGRDRRGGRARPADPRARASSSSTRRSPTSSASSRTRTTGSRCASTSLPPS